MRIDSGSASIANLRKSRASASRSSLACTEVDEQTSNTSACSAAHISSIALAMSTLY
jgi:hypothetical protein